MSEFPAAATLEPIKVSEDGYIRMTLQRFCVLPFAERQAFIDEDLRKELQDQDVPALRAGFCEWADATLGDVRICIGWAWFSPKAKADRDIMLAPGGISTNVMFVAADGRVSSPVKQTLQK